MLNSNETISVNVGEYIPLMFSLYDDFDNIIINDNKSFIELLKYNYRFYTITLHK